MKVEVQIRTIAMDFWSTIEHDVEYKHIISANSEIKAELKEMAEHYIKANDLHNSL